MEKWTVEEMAYWRRINELAFALGQEPVFQWSSPLHTALPFSTSLQDWADLAEDSAEPTWQFSNVLPSRLLLTRSNAQLTSSLGLGVTSRASSCRRKRASWHWPDQLPQHVDFKMAKQSNALQSQRLICILHCSCPCGGPHSPHQPQACPLALPVLAPLFWLVKGDFQDGSFLLIISKQPSFIHYEDFS